MAKSEQQSCDWVAKKDSAQYQELDDHVSGYSQVSILVVDDNIEIRNYIRKHLYKIHHLIEAADGCAALELPHKKLPGLIISDVMMPNMDRATLCRILKGDIELDYAWLFC